MGEAGRSTTALGCGRIRGTGMQALHYAAHGARCAGTRDQRRHAERQPTREHSTACTRRSIDFREARHPGTRLAAHLGTAWRPSEVVRARRASRVTVTRPAAGSGSTRDANVACGQSSSAASIWPARMARAPGCAPRRLRPPPARQAACSQPAAYPRRRPPGHALGVQRARAGALAGAQRARQRTGVVVVPVDRLLAQQAERGLLPPRERRQQLGHRQRLQVGVGQHVDAAVGAHRQRGAQLVLRARRRSSGRRHPRVPVPLRGRSFKGPGRACAALTPSVTATTSSASFFSFNLTASCSAERSQARREAAQAYRARLTRAVVLENTVQT